MQTDNLSSISRGHEYMKASRSRVLAEKRLLEFMFDFMPTITLNEQTVNSNYVELAKIINDKCDLNEYLKGSLFSLEYDDVDIESDTKVNHLARIIAALDAMSKLGLVIKKTELMHDKEGSFCWESGIFKEGWKYRVPEPYFCAKLIYNNYHTNEVNKNARKLGKEAQDRDFYIDLEYSENKEENSQFVVDRFMIRSITYDLSTKGYEAVQQSIQHLDNAKKAVTQSDISTASSEAAISSAKTAKYAICVAIFIAIGSIGNLLVPVSLPFQCKIPIAILFCLVGIGLSIYVSKKIPVAMTVDRFDE